MRKNLMRKNLQVFRIRLGLSQDAISEKIGCCRATYAAIENGVRKGNLTFWLNLKTSFDLSDSEMVEMMKIDE